MSPYLGSMITSERKLYFTLIGLGIEKQNIILQNLPLTHMQSILEHKNDHNFLSDAQIRLIKASLHLYSSNNYLINGSAFFQSPTAQPRSETMFDGKGIDRPLPYST